ncbi:hypothetical protein B484DRAFT_397459 [Ochromonadaceae sp. CCMP2298]|nr:hypothetical protein B484DRAFT_397459 [Ochromonadaceae sp. CCMP2298]
MIKAAAFTGYETESGSDKEDEVRFDEPTATSDALADKKQGKGRKRVCISDPSLQERFNPQRPPGGGEGGTRIAL